MAKLVKEDVIAGLKEMNMVEIMDLVHAIEDEFGVKAAAGVAAPAAAASVLVQAQSQVLFSSAVPGAGRQRCFQMNTGFCTSASAASRYPNISVAGIASCHALTLRSSSGRSRSPAVRHNDR